MQSLVPALRSLWKTTSKPKAAGSDERRIYKPLNASKKQIRILELHPGTYDDIVSVSLHITLLPTTLTWDPNHLATDGSLPRIEYEAISYCWGDTKAKSRILIDGIPFDAPASSVEVLRNFRRVNNERMMWVDAICINQADYDERSSQVAIMGQIYSSSSETQVWLGHDSEASAEAISFSYHISRLIRDRSNRTDLADYEKLAGIVCEVPWPHDDPFSLLAPVLGRPWFRRLWVYQEIVLSKYAVCHIGKRSIPWFDLELVVVWYYTLDYRNLNPWLEERYHWALAGQCLPMVDAVARLRRDPTANVSLYTLISMTRRLEASEPRDRIFSLLSLTNWARSGEQLPPGIRPNYRSSIRNCMRDVTRVIIEEEHNLDVLREIPCRRANSAELDFAWPSWVPFWGGNKTGEEESLWLMSIFSAGWICPIAVDPAVGKEDDSLCLEGIVCGKIFAMSRVLEREDYNSLPRIRRLVQELEPFVERAGGFATSTDILSFLSANRPSDLPNSDWNSAGMKALLNGTPAGDILALSTGRYVDEDNLFYSSAIENAAEREHLAEFKNNVSSTCGYRRFFQTNRGSVGIGPKDMQEGDVIAVLFGGNMPFVLREVEKQYRLVGTCYVHGIMHGEAVQEWAKSGTMPWKFRIY